MFAKVSLQDEANSFNVRIVKQINETESGVNWIFTLTFEKIANFFKRFRTSQLIIHTLENLCLICLIAAVAFFKLLPYSLLV
jgi:hypothetical protein